MDNPDDKRNYGKIGLRVNSIKTRIEARIRQQKYGAAGSQISMILYNIRK
ncbi:MAG: hypothetical protein ACYCTB_01805 [bacterium]